MKNTIENTNCMNDLLADSRHYVSKSFLYEARRRDLNLVDENVVIFSHQEVATVAAPFVVNGQEFNKNQSLILFYFKGGTGSELEDGFYTIQGNLDKDRINEKNLILLNSEGKVVQNIEIFQGEDEDGPSEPYDRNALEITDKHYKKTKNGVKVKVSGTYKGRAFVMKWKKTLVLKD
jgi:hypothetical protein